MTLATLILPALAPSLFAGSAAGSLVAPAPAVRAAVVKDLTYTTSAPALYVEGEAFEVSLTIGNAGDKAADVPMSHLTPAAWLVDGKALMRREKGGKLSLAPGQSISTSLDLAPAIAERFAEDSDDFRVKFSEDKKASEVIWLSLPASGIDFETLPKDQLDDYQVVLQTSGGPMWLELWPDVAPNHVRNFLDLAASGFYDGSDFHRVIPGFMAQAGQAKDGSKAPRTLDAEFSSRRHVTGVLSAARLGNDVNSASSEFFVVHKPSPHLDGAYTAFGKIITGEDSLEAIVKGVEVHYELVNAFAKNGVRVDPRRPGVALAMNKPNPAQVIRQALVVRATKSRPKAN